jgi:hypothetical protein
MNVPFKSPQPELGVAVLALDEVEVVTVVEPAVSLDVGGVVVSAVELLASSNVAWESDVFLAVEPFEESLDPQPLVVSKTATAIAEQSVEAR